MTSNGCSGACAGCSFGFCCCCCCFRTLITTSNCFADTPAKQERVPSVVMKTHCVQHQQDELGMKHQGCDLMELTIVPQSSAHTLKCRQELLCVLEVSFYSCYLGCLGGKLLCLLQVFLLDLYEHEKSDNFLTDAHHQSNDT